MYTLRRRFYLRSVGNNKMKNLFLPPFLFMVSIISILLVIKAAYPWELLFVFVPIACLIAFYSWLDNNER